MSTPEPTPVRRRVRAPALLLQVGGTLAALGLLAWKLDLSSVGALLWGSSASGFVLGTLLAAGSHVAASQRWRTLLAASGGRAGLLDLTRLTVEGLFVNQLLPGFVGGDAARFVRLRRWGVPVSAGVTSVLADRVVGLVTLLVAGLLGLPVLAGVAGWRDPAVQGVAVVATGGLLAVVVGAVLVRVSPTVTRRWPALRRLVEPVAALVRALSQPGPALSLLASAVASQALILVAFVPLASAVGLDAPVTHQLAVLPAAYLVSLVPLSVGGWGLREGAMAAGFALLGHDPDAAVAASVLFGLSQVVISLPALVSWWVDPVGETG